MKDSKHDEGDVDNQTVATLDDDAVVLKSKLKQQGEKTAKSKSKMKMKLKLKRKVKTMLRRYREKPLLVWPWSQFSLRSRITKFTTSKLFSKMSDTSVSQETLILGVVEFLLESKSDPMLAVTLFRNFLQQFTGVALTNDGLTVLKNLQVDQGILDDLERINLETIDGWDDMRKFNLDKRLEGLQEAQIEEAQKVRAAREAEERVESRKGRAICAKLCCRKQSSQPEEGSNFGDDSDSGGAVVESTENDDARPE